MLATTAMLPTSSPFARLMPDWVRRRVRSGNVMSDLLFAGMFSDPSENGECAELCAQALTRHGWRVTRLDIAPALEAGFLVARPAAPPLPARGPVIVHANPPLFDHALALIGPRRLAGRKVIGYWSCPVEEAPDDWRVASSAAQEIWTPSRFSAMALRGVVPVPVRVVPPPVAPPALSRRAIVDRAGYGLPRDACVFLTFASLRGNLAHDNPWAAIDAYARAFSDPRQDVLLVVKLDGASVAPALVMELRAMAGRCAAPVRFITDALDIAQRDRLIASCDVVVSLHRGEAFGVHLARSMTLRRPVVATAWSGNLDFMSPACAALVEARLAPVRHARGVDQPLRWAEPDIAQAAIWLRRLAEAPSLRESLGTAAAALDLSAQFDDAVRQSQLDDAPAVAWKRC